MNKNGNRLHQDTGQRIQEALLNALEQRPIERITVRQICEAAGINRSTFYRHYLDIYDLMEKTEWDIHSKMLARHFGGESMENRLTDRSTLTGMLGYVSQYRSFYLGFFRRHPHMLLEEGYRAVWAEHHRPLFLALGVTDDNQMEYYYRFFHAGMLSVITGWLEKDCPEEPEQIAEIIFRMRRMPEEYLPRPIINEQ